MPFSAGELCCVSSACVLLDTTPTGNPTWDLIPHVTNISFEQTSSTPKLVTSSTGGLETSVCGTVTQSGNLAIACHDGTAPSLLCINGVYHIRWSLDCDNIWANGAATTGNSLGAHFEAFIRITRVPINYNISANQAIIYEYGFDIVSWSTAGSPGAYCQASE